MKRKTKIVIAALVGVLGVGGIAVAAQGYQKHKQMKRMFSPEQIMQRIDIDGDSAISKGEVTTLLRTHFDKADIDGNQKVSTAEIVTAIDAVEGFDRIKKRSGRIADRIVQSMDIDQDGVLTFEEVSNRVGKVHALADWNDDDKVELSEVKRVRSAFSGRRDKR